MSHDQMLFQELVGNKGEKKASTCSSLQSLISQKQIMMSTTEKSRVNNTGSKTAINSFLLIPWGGIVCNIKVK